MADWTMATAVGTGEKGFGGDGGPAGAALLNGPFDIAFDFLGNMYFSDTFNNRIRRVEAATGIITTIAGNGDKGYSGDGGPATAAALAEPYGVVVDRAGNVYTADRLNSRVRRIDGASRGSSPPWPAPAKQVIPAMAGRRRGPLWPSRTASPSIRASATSISPTSRATGCGSSIWCCAASHLCRHRRRRAQRRRRSGSQAGVFGARAVKVAADGTVYILERQGSSLRAVDPKTGIISKIAGTGARGLWRRWRRRTRRGVRRAEGDGARSRRQPLDRRYREPRDPPHRPRPASSRRSPAAAAGPRAMAARPRRPGSTGRTVPSSARTARSISATPTTTGCAKSCAHRNQGNPMRRAVTAAAVVAGLACGSSLGGAAELTAIETSGKGTIRCAGAGSSFARANPTTSSRCRRGTR